MALVQQTVTRWVLAGKRVKAGTEGAEKVTGKTRMWYGEIPRPGKQLKRVPLSTNKRIATRMYARLLERHERDRTGTLDPVAEHADTPLSQHLKDFRKHVEAGRGKGGRKPDPAHVDKIVGRAERILAACGAALASDIDLADVRAELAALAAGEPVEVPDRPLFTREEACGLLGIAETTFSARVHRLRLPRSGQGRGGGPAVRYPRETVLALARCRGGAAPATVAGYAAALRRFTAWLVADGRIHSDPLARLDTSAPDSAATRRRRPLSAAQVEHFLATARAGGKRFRGLTGEDRWALYLTALSTGFRCEELASLTPARFLLDHTPPVVRLGMLESKNDKGATQPLPSAVVPPLREYLADRDTDSPVWPGKWWRLGAEMLRRDLEAAGIPYQVPGPDGPLTLDFHALRHSFGAMLKRAGVTLSAAMRLMRHSDPKLTMAVYGREDLAELGAAVDGIAVTGMVTGGLTATSGKERKDTERDGNIPAGEG